MYVTSDHMYDNNVVTPAMIVVHRRMGKARATEGKKDAWVVYDYAYDHDHSYDCDDKEPPLEQPRNSVKQKAVDEDLYRISPELLHVKPKRKKWWLFSSCMQPTCVM
ncbi:uncharacterized protein LOC143569269 [Bidens hawaiensis]|uniref:uncharacterized protein LOC143569269 n=1 Tax=Bidens hawaiensis TaxID=980011 RepID=UPI00404A2F54